MQYIIIIDILWISNAVNAIINILWLYIILILICVLLSILFTMCHNNENINEILMANVIQ